MKKIVVYLSLLFILVACSNEKGDNPGKNTEITKAYVEDSAEVGLTYSEVRERFGEAVLADVVDNTETWLYDSSQSSDFEYNQSLESVAFEEIKEGNLDYQLYINFIDEKAFMYSYFYLEEDGKIWKYQLTPDGEPSNNPVSN